MSDSGATLLLSVSEHSSVARDAADSIGGVTIIEFGVEFDTWLGEQPDTEPVNDQAGLMLQHTSSSPSRTATPIEPPLSRCSPGCRRWPVCRTIAADKAYGTEGFVGDVRPLGFTPYVAPSTKHSAIDGRTTRHRHAGHQVSQRIRKRAEEPFRLAKTIAGGRQRRYRGRQRNRAWFS